MLPAVGQGALCIEARQDDDEITPILEMLNHVETNIVVTGERTFLKRLEGSCHIPVACFGKIHGNTLIMTGLVSSMDGTQIIKETLSGELKFKDQIGIELAEMLLKQGAQEILDNL